MFSDIRQYVAMRSSSHEQELDQYWDQMFAKVGRSGVGFCFRFRIS